MPFELVWTEEAAQTFEQLQADAEHAKANRQKSKRTKASKQEESTTSE